MCHCLLPHFKKVNICASIDGAYAVGEYIRDGLNWSEWIENFQEGLFLVDQFGDDAMVFDVTLTTPGFFDLKRMFDVVTELNVKSYFKITFAFDPSVLMSPMCLPRAVLDEQIHTLLDYIKPRVTPKTRVYQETLENMLERKTFEEEFINYADFIRN